MKWFAILHYKIIYMYNYINKKSIAQDPIIKVLFKLKEIAISKKKIITNRLKLDLSVSLLTNEMFFS